MAKYIVKSVVVHDGVEYAPGQVLELLEWQAQAMPWAVELQVPPAPAASAAPAKKRKE
jgi:hypothetical protein